MNLFSPDEIRTELALADQTARFKTVHDAASAEAALELARRKAELAQEQVNKLSRAVAEAGFGEFEEAYFVDAWLDAWSDATCSVSAALNRHWECEDFSLPDWQAHGFGAREYGLGRAA